MADYDKHYREMKGMEKGQLVMVEAKYISVPAKKVVGVMDSEKLNPRWFGPYAIAAWHNGCDVEIERGGRHGLHPRSRVHPVFHISKVKLFKGVSKKAALFGDDGAVEPDQSDVRCLGLKPHSRLYISKPLPSTSPQSLASAAAQCAV